MNTQPLWGIDLGGTKIEGVILRSEADPEVLCRLRVPTESSQGYSHVMGQVRRLLDLLTQESGLKPTALGMGTPGTCDPQTGLHKNSNTTCLNGKPFRQDLETALQMPVYMANDANCFALAEARMGIVRDTLPGAEVVFGVILGTGVGGGVVVRGHVLNGRQGIAGEWGHNVLDASGGACYCGKTGCVETLICGPALQRYYLSLSGQARTLKEIVQRSESDVHAAATIQRLTSFFGLAIASIINILDPDAIVLGGGVGNIDALYTDGVEAAKPHVFNSRLDTVFLKPKLGDSAGVFGAAYLTV